MYKTDFTNVVYYFDELIVSEIKKRNEVALRELYKTHYPMIVNLICTNSGTEQEAKDIYQEAVIAFYEKVQSPGFTLTCKIKTYLYAVCRRLWLKRSWIALIGSFFMFRSIRPTPSPYSSRNSPPITSAASTILRRRAS